MRQRRNGSRLVSEPILSFNLSSRTSCRRVPTRAFCGNGFSRAQQSRSRSFPRVPRPNGSNWRVPKRGRAGPERGYAGARHWFQMRRIVAIGRCHRQSRRYNHCRAKTHGHHRSRSPVLRAGSASPPSRCILCRNRPIRSDRTRRRTDHNAAVSRSPGR